MEQQVKLGVGGIFDIKQIRNGLVIATRQAPNIVTDKGLDLITGVVLTDITKNDCDEIAIGTGGITGSATSNGAADGTTVIDTGQTAADDYWNEVTMTMTSGTAIGESVNVLAVGGWVNATNTFTMVGTGFSAQIDSGDNYILSARPVANGLQTEITTGGGARLTAGNVAGTQQQTTIANDTAQLVGTFNFTAAFAVNEVGIFNDPSAGDMLAGSAFGVVNVQNGDALQITYKVQVQRA